MTDDDRNTWCKTDEPLELRLSGLSTPLFLRRKKFKTGSIGWYLSQKAVLSDTPVQLSLCITVIGSKPDPVEPGVNKSSEYPGGLIPAQDLREVEEWAGDPPANGRKRQKRS
jgi:hypothetical protein